MSDRLTALTGLGMDSLFLRQLARKACLRMNHRGGAFCEDCEVILSALEQAREQDGWLVKELQGVIERGLHVKCSHCASKQAEIERLTKKCDDLARLMNESAAAAKDAEADAERLAARIKQLEESAVRHFQEEHLAGDGPEIDRWKRRVKHLTRIVTEVGEAALAFRESNREDDRRRMLAAFITARDAVLSFQKEESK
jgi:hypothetical protein